MKDIEIEEALVYKATQAGVPLNAVFELTPVCNMKCRMCYARLTPEETRENGGMKSAAEWKAAAGAAAEAGTLFVLLTGGEPLLHPEFREIYLGLQELGMIVSVNTNGTLLDEEWADFFEQNPPRRINITLYGASPDTYQRVCGYRQGYEKVLRGIELLLKRKIAVKMNGTLIQENAEEYEKMQQLAEQMGVYLKVDSYIFPYARGGRAQEIRKCRLMPESQGYYQYCEKKKSDNFYNYVMHAPIAQTLMKNREQKEELAGEPGEEKQEEWQEAECRAGRSSYWLDYRMRMLPCIFLPDASFSLEMGFSEAWEACRKWMDELHLYAGCKDCAGKRFCNICAAALYTENERYDKKPEYLCQCTESYITYLSETKNENESADAGKENRV